jgi:tetratricopeptide (TPR) repeat protein
MVARYCQNTESMFGGRPIRLARIALTVLILLLPSGCQQRRKTVELYLDAVMFTELGQNQKALERLNEAVRTDRRFSFAYSLLGQVYERMEDYEKSAASYERATELNPRSFKDHFNLGRIYSEVNKPAKAAEAYARACEIRPDHLLAHLNAARCGVALKDFNRASIYALQAERIDPNEIGVHSLLASIYEAQGDDQGAIRCYERLLATGGNDTEVITSLALAYLRAGRYKSARGLLTSVVEMEPNNGNANYYLGHCCLKLDDTNSAIAAYMRAIQINDRDWRARKGLGAAYMSKAIAENDEPLKSTAVQQWRASLAIKPDQPGHQALLGLIRRHSK